MIVTTWSGEENKFLKEKTQILVYFKIIISI